MAAPESSLLWWQKGTIYQIYIRSFMDSNGDGIGDLKGITQRLDYLKWLGVDALWITPFYPSPMADFGYDVADYRGIHELFGTMPDFDELLKETHARGLRLILDLVPNHSSHEHPWFKESRASRNNPKRDWYLWHDPAPDGGPPNNWQSVFGSSAWEWDEKTSQYYYHAFLKEQPDLNLRNPEVREAILDVMRFWLAKGIDGFRVDVMWHMIKDKQWRDNPPNPDYKKGMPSYDKYIPLYSTDQPDVHDVVAEMRQLMDQFDERVLIGEMYLPIERQVYYYGLDNSGAHLPGNFQLLLLPWDARTIGREIDKYEAALPVNAWPNWVLSNHDRPRLCNRVGKDQLRVAAMLLLTLRGTPTLYYGDEIGMCNVPIPEDEIQDPQGKEGESRDPQRTPMQWETGKNAGFTSGNPWLRMAEDAREVNVETQREDPDSLLSFYRRLIQLRRQEKALHAGSYFPVPAEGDILAYIREAEGRQLLIVLNMGGKAAQFTTDKLNMKGRIILGTNSGREEKSAGEKLTLKGGEGVIIRLENTFTA
jgi:alpha-glucosidase